MVGVAGEMDGWDWAGVGGYKGADRQAIAAPPNRTRSSVSFGSCSGPLRAGCIRSGRPGKWTQRGCGNGAAGAGSGRL